MLSGLTKHTITTPIKDPILIGVSLVFAAILYAINQQANIYDIHNHEWVITMGVLILGSPIVHALFLTRMRAIISGGTATLAAGMNAGGSLYTRLVGGEIVVSLIAAAGMVLLILPGVYIGLRLSLYKQAILFDGRTISGALRESMVRTRFPRQWGIILLLYALIYGGELLIAYGVEAVSIGTFGDVAMVVVSALGFAWLNAALTVIYLQRSP